MEGGSELADVFDGVWARLYASVVDGIDDDGVDS